MPIHSTLTGSQLHEPKGAATAAAGKVYVADGAGSGSWVSPLQNIANITSPSGTSIVFNNTTYALGQYQILVCLFNLTAASSAANLRVQLSTDNGSSYNTTTYTTWFTDHDSVDASFASGLPISPAETAVTQHRGIFTIYNFNKSTYRTFLTATSWNGSRAYQSGGYEDSPVINNTFRFQAGGSISAGFIQLSGIKG